MRRSLSAKEAQAVDSRPGHSWLDLAGLCCKAVGGEPGQADGVAAAWALLYTSAHIFDSIQDDDPPDPWWQELGKGAALNVASGLLMTAWGVLNRLEVESRTRRRLLEDFQATVLRMASGQHLDLTDSAPSLEQAWAVAETKSGEFFALPCRCGARVGGASESVATKLGEYGFNLGLMVQIGDDLGDLASRQTAPPLAVAYCMRVASAQGRNRLSGMHPARPIGSAERIEACQLVADSGAVLYLVTKLGQFRARALESLSAAEAEPSASLDLSALIENLLPVVENAPP